MNCQRRRIAPICRSMVLIRLTVLFIYLRFSSRLLMLRPMLRSVLFKSFRRASYSESGSLGYERAFRGGCKGWPHLTHSFPDTFLAQQRGHRLIAVPSPVGRQEYRDWSACCSCAGSSAPAGGGPEQDRKKTRMAARRAAEGLRRLFLRESDTETSLSPALHRSMSF